MAFPYYYDRVCETSITLGTGTLTLAGAVSGFQAFSVVGNAKTCFYSITMGSDWETGVGTYTSSGTTLSRDEVFASSNGGSKVDWGAGTKRVFLSVLSPSLWPGFEVPGGRLTFTTGTPETTSDVTGATTVYYTPWLHNGIKLWTGSAWRWFRFDADLSVSLSSVSAGRCYDVVCYATGTPLAPALELVAWNDQSSGSITGATNATPIVITSNSHGLANDDVVIISGVGGNTAANGTFRVASVATNTFALNTMAGASVAGSGTYTSGGTWRKLNQTATRSSAVSRTDGALTLSSDKTRLVLGCLRASADGTGEDSEKSRLLANYYHRRWRTLRAYDTTDSWSVGTTTNPRPSNNTLALGTSRVEVFSPFGDTRVRLDYLSYGSHGSAWMNVGIGLDSVSAFSSQAGGATTALAVGQVSAAYRAALGTGYHFLQALERCSSGMGMNYGDNAGLSHQSGMVGEVEG